MNTTAITKSTKQLTRAINKQSPTILTVLGVAGLLGSVASAIKATPKALEALDNEREFRRSELNDTRPLEVVDVLQTTWKFYLPTIGLTAATIACMIGSNTINLRRNAALASLLTIAETTFHEYQQEVRKQIGEKKEEKVRTDLNQKRLDENPVSRSVIVTSKGKTLCRDSLSGRDFYSDIDGIKKLVNEFNRRLLSEMTITLNEFYADLELEPTVMGRNSGWTVEKGLLDIAFIPGMTKDDELCAVLEYKTPPTNIWG